MWRPEFETHGIKDIDDFARKVFEGKFSYGDIKIYNKSGIFPDSLRVFAHFFTAGKCAKFPVFPV